MPWKLPPLQQFTFMMKKFIRRQQKNVQRYIVFEILSDAMQAKMFEDHDFALEVNLHKNFVIALNSTVEGTEAH